MRLAPGRHRVPSLLAALMIIVGLPACTVEAGDEAAHALADMFAADSEPRTDAGTPQEPGKNPAPATAAEPNVAQSVPAPAAPTPAPPSVKSAEDEAKRAEGRRLAAEKAEAQRRAKAQREADEADMLARARSEAEERRLEQENRLRQIERAEAEAARRAEEEQQRKAEAARRAEAAAAEEARKAAEARRLAAEREREEEIRKAAEARRQAELAAAEEARKAAEARRLAAERELAEEEARRAAEARRQTEIAAAEEARRQADFAAAEAARRAEQERRAAELAVRQQDGRRVALERAETERLARLEAEREQESQRLSEKLRRVREARLSRDGQEGAPYGLGGPARAEAGASVDEVRPPPPTRVTILLEMEPGNRGIRRFNKTADPILCVEGACYLSRGADAPAEAMSRGRAFGPGVALGRRAGLCSHSLTCVFRGIDLGRQAVEVQPIDLRILRHDRREPRLASPDPTCRVQSGRLTCRRVIVAGDYAMWVVPEAVAEQAGAVALETAVRSGLADGQSAALAE